MSLFPSRRLRARFFAGKPPLSRLRPAVEAGNVRLDVEQRRPVEDVDPADDQPVSLPADKAHDGEADPVRPAGVAGGKHPVRRIVQEGRAHELHFSGPVEPVEEDEVGEGLDILERRSVLREDLHDPFRLRNERPLDGGILFRAEGGVDDPDCVEPV